MFGLGALAAVLLAFYLPVLSGRLAFFDDYAYFWPPSAAKTDPVRSAFSSRDFNYVRALNRCGRPLTAFYLKLCAGLIRWSRSPDLGHLPGLVGVVLLGLATFAWLRRWHTPAAPAFLVCLTLLTLPAAQICVAWINSGSYLWAALTATVALFLFAPALRQPRPGWAEMLLRGAAAWLLLLAAMFTYQPAALYYWALTAAALLLAPPQDWAGFRARVAPLLLLGLAAMGGYFVAYRIFFSLLGLPTLPRGDLTGDPLGKLSWFWNEPLRNVLSLWVTPPTTPRLVWWTGALLVVGAALDAATARGRRALTSTTWLTAFALVPLSYSFNLAVQENWAAYRTLLALYAVVVVLAFAALTRLTALLGRRLREPARIGVLACAALASLFCGETNLMRLAILPRILEFEYLKAQLLQPAVQATHRIHVIRPHIYDGPAPATIYDEFGLPTSAIAWAPESMVRRALQELGYRGPTLQLTQSSPDDPPPDARDAAVIDLRAMWLLNPNIPR
jgi:hypothetical protein